VRRPNDTLPRLALAASALLGTVLVCGCARRDAVTTAATASPATAPANAVAIDNFTFTPAELTVSAGDTVTWTNRDDVPHTVVSQGSDPTLRSDALDTSDTYSHAFPRPGTYDYYCSIHTHMTGRIVVKPLQGSH
jgi:amicyanin